MPKDDRNSLQLTAEEANHILIALSHYYARKAITGDHTVDILMLINDIEDLTGLDWDRRGFDYQGLSLSFADVD